MVNVWQKIKTWGQSKYLFALACAAMPWVDLLPVTTWLFILLGVYLFFEVIVIRKRFPKSFPDVLSLLFFTFYLFQIIAWLQLPKDVFTRFSLEQKASLLFVPLLLSFHLDKSSEKWITGIKGFIAGNLLACIYCMSYAIAAFLQTGSYHTFFYHQFSSAVHANAIYMSLYVLVAMFALLYYQQAQMTALPSFAMLLCVTFFTLSIVLLSSKALIAIGSLLLILFFIRSMSWKYATLITVSIALITIVLGTTHNPVSKRFRDMKVGSYQDVLHQKDFTNYNFSDLDLRLVLWKMGLETLTEHNGWITGLEGRAYHNAFNKKIRSYKMFEGNSITKDTGYINYNMHNQYMENLLQFGIIGLITLIGILLITFISAVKQCNTLLVTLIVLFAASFLSESVLETQSGILLFTTFIYGEWKRSKLARMSRNS